MHFATPIAPKRWNAVPLFALVTLLPAGPAGAATVPPDFVVENAVPGVAFDTPTAITFLPDGRMLVAEKRGRVYLVDNGVRQETPVWSHTDEVLDSDDRGLLDVAVDPDFNANHRIYLLYTVDPDSNGVDDNDDAFGRLTRYTVNMGAEVTVDSTTRAILFGSEWSNGPLIASTTHTIGRLQFGEDKSLLVSIGEGASFTVTDDGGFDPQAFLPGRTDPYEDIGAFRAQYLGSLCGKVLRLDPETGHGYPGNPWYDGDPMSVQSRVWQYGLRNPFRMELRPGTGNPDPAASDPGTLYIGDVGNSLWEEISVASSAGHNFGWPCWEGIASQGAYQAAAPAHHGCGTMGTPENPALHTPPLMSWHHTDPSLSTPPGLRGNSTTGLAFYGGSHYPASYQGSLFFADFGRSWIKVARLDASDQLLSVQDFGEAMDGPVDVASEPVSGDLYYVAINVGEVRRIRYTGMSGNQPPVANAGVTPSTGIAPTIAAFSSVGSFDPDGDLLSFSWSFGDGNGSTTPQPTHAYEDGGMYNAVLTVSDTAGGVSRDTVIVVVMPDATFPTTGVLDDFDHANGPIGDAWVDERGALAIVDSVLTQPSGYASVVWSTEAFGPNQEAFVTLDEVTATAPEHDLMLKVQGLEWETGHLEVRFDARFPRVLVNSYTPGIGWRTHGFFTGVDFVAGDQLGARAYATGVVEVFKNGLSIGKAQVNDWPWHQQGGYLGMTIGYATQSRFDNFGGGDAVVVANTPPHAVIESPAEGTFYADGDTIHLVGRADDAETAADDHQYEWRVELLHNNHAHPSLTATGRTASFVVDPHEDGTGVRYRVQLRVRDQGGQRDTSFVTIWPQVDLNPMLEVTSEPVAAGASFPIRLTLRNLGCVLARTSHWAVVVQGLVLAQGDTIVAPRDSVVIDRMVLVPLPSGVYEVRAVADTGCEVVETDETNNFSCAPLLVTSGNVDVAAGLPGALDLSLPRPNPTRSSVTFSLTLPRAERVRFEVHDVLGRAVSTSTKSYEAGTWVLRWDARDSRGAALPPGIYLASVEIGSRRLIRRVAVVR